MSAEGLEKSYCVTLACGIKFLSDQVPGLVIPAQGKVGGEIIFPPQLFGPKAATISVLSAQELRAFIFTPPDPSQARTDWQRAARMDIEEQRFFKSLGQSGWQLRAAPAVWTDRVSVEDRVEGALVNAIKEAYRQQLIIGGGRVNNPPFWQELMSLLDNKDVITEGSYRPLVQRILRITKALPQHSALAVEYLNLEV